MCTLQDGRWKAACSDCTVLTSFLFFALLDFEFRAINSSGFRSTRSITRAPLCLCVIFSFPYVCAQSSEFSTLCFLSSKPKGPSARYFRFLQRTRYLESGKKPWWNLLLSWGGKFEPISMRLLSLKLQPGRNCCKCQRILQRMGLCPFFCSGVLTIWVKHGAGRARNAINQAESQAERTDSS